MVGFTHEDMGQLGASLYRSSGSTDDRVVTVRYWGSNARDANNFTSYDLLQKSALSSTWFSRDDFTLAGRTWFVDAYDSTVNKKGQIEYLQFQVTVHTSPNRADTDADSLNDLEELNLGSDGFATDPWKTDTDGDGLEANGWSRSGGTIVANPNGFRTDPTLADTDRDGVRDDVDRVPLGDAFVEMRIESTYVSGSDAHNSGGVPLPFVKASIQANDTYTSRLSSWSGSWITTDYNTLTTYSGHRLSVNVPDDGSQVWIMIAMWSYDSRGYNQHTPIIAGSHTEYLAGVPYCVDDTTVSIPYSLQAPGESTPYPLRGCSGSGLRANPLNVTIATIVPDRVTTDLVLPADYSGVYNVTDASGAIVGRRYVGEPQFVAILLNATTWEPTFHCYCGPPVPMSILVPRSVFFDTELYKRLNASNPPPPLDKLAFRQNSTSASSNSDALQQLLTGNVTMGDWLTILDLLRYNGTNVLVRVALRLTSSMRPLTPSSTSCSSTPAGKRCVSSFSPRTHSRSSIPCSTPCRTTTCSSSATSHPRSRPRWPTPPAKAAPRPPTCP